VKGIDTNVLVRYLTGDDPGQSASAARVIEDALDHGEMLFVSAVVLCEMVWVFESAYGLSRSRVADALEGVLRSAQLRFADPALCWRALGAYRAGPGDFADYLIGLEAGAGGASTTYTFDRALRGSGLFTVL
jgi:predicted nucleic-acid-binding protein